MIPSHKTGSSRDSKAGGRMASMAVYRFSCWDQDTGEEVTSSRFATLKAIKACNGRSIETSRRLVESSELDQSGFYQPPAMRKEAEPHPASPATPDAEKAS
jgi:hypothetical protein